MAVKKPRKSAAAKPANEARLHPKAPHNQPFNVVARHGKKRGWSTTRGHNNQEKHG